MYNERVLNIEHGSFTPLVFSANGGMARECSKFYARLSELLSTKRSQHYSVISAWVRRKITFSLMKSICMCLRGSRSIHSEKIITSMTEDAEVSEKSTQIKIA